LKAIGAAVAAAAPPLFGDAADAGLPGALVALQSRLADLRTAARPELQGLGVARQARLRHRIILLEACIAWALELGRISLDGARLTEKVALEQARLIAGVIDNQVARLTRPGAEMPSTAAFPAPAAPVVDSRAVLLLRRIELSLAHVGQYMPAR